MARMSNDEYVKLGTAIEVRRTAKAVLIAVQGEEYWVPLSQVRWSSAGVSVAKWLADKNGIPYNTVKASDGQYEGDDGDWEPIDPHDRGY